MNEQETSPNASSAQLRPRSKRQVASLTSPKHAPPEFERGRGVRHDVTFAHDRSKIRRPNANLVDAAEEMWRRRGRLMTATDRNTLGELANRTWDVYDCDGCHFRGVPSWLATELNCRRRAAGYSYFLGLVIAAYRAGSCGLWMSYSEAMGLLDVGSESTWRRWCDEWEKKGLVTIVQTWTDDPAGQYGRVHGRLWYRLGPVLQEFAAALCDDACGKSTNERAIVARKAANAERREQRRRTQERIVDNQHRREAHNDPRRRTRRAPGQVRVTEPPPDAPPKVDDKRSCNSGYIHAGEVTVAKAADPKGFFDDRNALPLGEIPELEKPNKNVTTAQARSSSSGRPSGRRGPPGAAMRIEVLEHAMRGLRSQGRKVTRPVTDPSATEQPDSQATKVGAGWPISEPTQRALREFLLRTGASNRALASTLRISTDDAVRLRADYEASKSVILDIPEKIAEPPDKPRSTIDLPDDITAALRRLSGR